MGLVLLSPHPQEVVLTVKNKSEDEFGPIFGIVFPSNWLRAITTCGCDLVIATSTESSLGGKMNLRLNRLKFGI